MNRVRRHSLVSADGLASLAIHSAWLNGVLPPQPKAAAKPALTHCRRDRRSKIGRISAWNDGRVGAARLPLATNRSRIRSHMVRTDFCCGA
ncbi:hypothetical protein D3C81_1868500 [compost metagenome]